MGTDAGGQAGNQPCGAVRPHPADTSRHFVLCQRKPDYCRTLGGRHSAIAYQAALFGTPRCVMGKMNQTISAGSAVWKKIDSFGGNSTSPTLTAWRPCPVCGALECRTLL